MSAVTTGRANTGSAPIATLVDSSKLDRFEHIGSARAKKFSGNSTAPRRSRFAGTIRDDISLTKLYALAVDRDGVTWVKRLNRDVLAAPRLRRPANVHPRARLTHHLQRRYARPAPGRLQIHRRPGGKTARNAAGSLTPSQRQQILQTSDLSIPGDILSDHQWHQLTAKLRDEGSLANDLPSTHMQLNPDSGMFRRRRPPRLRHVVPETHRRRRHAAARRSSTEAAQAK